MPKRQVYIQKYVLQLNTVSSRGTTTAILHRFGRNGTSNNRDSENRDCTVFALPTVVRTLARSLVI